MWRLFAGAIYENQLYYSDNLCNALMRFDLTTELANYIGEFPNVGSAETYIHKRAYVYGDNIYFIPDKGKNIPIYHIKTNEIEFVEVYRSSDTDYVFCDGLFYGNFLWIFPGNIEQPMIRFDLSSKKTEILNNFYGIFHEKIEKQQQGFCKICRVKDDVYMALLSTSKIIKYNMRNMSIKVIDSKIAQLDSVYSIDEEIIICTIDGKAYLWNTNIDEKTLCTLHRTRKVKGAYAAAVSKNREIYLIPNNGKEILKKRKNEPVFDNSELLVFDEDMVFNEDMKSVNEVNFETYCQWGNDLILFPFQGRQVVVLSNREVRELKGELAPEQEMYRDKSYQAARKNILEHIQHEGDLYSLKEYIEIWK